MSDPSICSDRELGTPVDVIMPPPAEPAEDVPAVPRRWTLTSEERESILHGAARRDARSRLVSRLVTLAAVAGLAALVYGGATAWLARHRVRELLLEAARAKNLPHVAAELTPRLALAVSECNRAIAADPQPDNLPAMLDGLRAVLARLPADADLTPLLELSPQADGARPKAVRLVRERLGRDPLIAHTCSRSATARAFAVECLRPSFPLGQLADGEAAQLAQRMGIEQKTALCDRVYAAVHRRLEARWTGRYRIGIDAAWRDLGRRPVAHSRTTPAPPIRVACSDRIWRIQLGTARWAGTIDELADLRLTCTASELFGFAIFTTPWDHLLMSKATLSFDDGFRLSIGPLPRYADASRGWTPLGRQSQMPRGACITGTQIRARAGFPKPGLAWVLPPQPGFETFEARVLRQAASQ